MDLTCRCGGMLGRTWTCGWWSNTGGSSRGAARAAAAHRRGRCSSSPRPLDRNRGNDRPGESRRPRTRRSSSQSRPDPGLKGFWLCFVFIASTSNRGLLGVARRAAAKRPSSRRSARSERGLASGDGGWARPVVPASAGQRGARSGTRLRGTALATPRVAPSRHARRARRRRALAGFRSEAGSTRRLPVSRRRRRTRVRKVAAT